jgi:hypothetical protein
VFEVAELVVGKVHARICVFTLKGVE